MLKLLCSCERPLTIMKHWWNVNVKWKKTNERKVRFQTGKFSSINWQHYICWLLIPPADIVDEIKWNVEWMDPNCWEQQRLHLEILIQVSSSFKSSYAIWSGHGDIWAEACFIEQRWGNMAIARSSYVMICEHKLKCSIL